MIKLRRKIADPNNDNYSTIDDGTTESECKFRSDTSTTSSTVRKNKN